MKRHRLLKLIPLLALVPFLAKAQTTNTPWVTAQIFNDTFGAGANVKCTFDNKGGPAPWADWDGDVDGDGQSNGVEWVRDLKTPIDTNGKMREPFTGVRLWIWPAGGKAGTGGRQPAVVSGTNAFDSGYLNALEDAVEYCLENGLAVVLTMREDEFQEVGPASGLAAYKAFWNQLTDRFDRDFAAGTVEKFLAFELLNEPKQEFDDPYTGTDPDYAAGGGNPAYLWYQIYNQEGLEVVRDGGAWGNDGDRNRVVILPCGQAQRIEDSAILDFEIPNVPAYMFQHGAGAPKVMLGVHLYDPGSFTQVFTWGGSNNPSNGWYLENALFTNDYLDWALGTGSGSPVKRNPFGDFGFSYSAGDKQQPFWGLAHSGNGFTPSDVEFFDTYFITFTFDDVAPLASNPSWLKFFNGVERMEAILGRLRSIQLSGFDIQRQAGKLQGVPVMVSEFGVAKANSSRTINIDGASRNQWLRRAVGRVNTGYSTDGFEDFGWSFAVYAMVGAAVQTYDGSGNEIGGDLFNLYRAYDPNSSKNEKWEPWIWSFRNEI